MIIDPETAHNITNGAAVVMDSGAGAATAAEVSSILHQNIFVTGGFLGSWIFL